MCPTNERNTYAESGTDERAGNKRRDFSWGLRPQTPGIYRFDANPS